MHQLREVVEVDLQHGRFVDQFGRPGPVRQIARPCYLPPITVAFLLKLGLCSAPQQRSRRLTRSGVVAAASRQLRHTSEKACRGSFAMLQSPPHQRSSSDSVHRLSVV